MRLTADEIKLVVFVLMALLAGAAVKHYRGTSAPALPRAAASAAPHFEPAAER